MFVSAISSMSRPPIGALAGNERQLDRDRIYGIELFVLLFLTVTYWHLAESRVPAFNLQMVFIKEIKILKKARMRNSNCSRLNAVVCNGLTSVHKHEPLQVLQRVWYFLHFWRCTSKNQVIQNLIQGSVFSFSFQSLWCICARRKSKVPCLFSWVAKAL